LEGEGDITYISMRVHFAHKEREREGGRGGKRGREKR